MRVTQLLLLLQGIYGFSQAHRDGRATSTQHTISCSHCLLPAIKICVPALPVTGAITRHSTVSGQEDSQRWLFSSLVRLMLPGRLHCFLENRDENQTRDALVLISLGKYSACEQKDDPKHKSGRITEICMWLEEG